MPWTSEQFWQRRARAKLTKYYGRNEAGMLVRKTAFRQCDNKTPNQLHEFANEDEVLDFEAACYLDGTGYRVKFWSAPPDTVPKEQLALQSTLTNAVQQDGNETRVQMASVEQGLHESLAHLQETVEQGQNHSKSGSQLQREATRRKQEEARDKLAAHLRYVERPVPEEPLQSLTYYKGLMREPALVAAVNEKRAREAAGH